MSEEWKPGDILVATERHSLLFNSDLPVGAKVEFIRPHHMDDTLFFGRVDRTDYAGKPYKAEASLRRAAFKLEARAEASGPDYTKHADGCRWNAGGCCDCHMAPPRDTVYGVEDFAEIARRAKEVFAEQTEILNKKELP